MPRADGGGWQVGNRRHKEDKIALRLLRQAYTIHSLRVLAGKLGCHHVAVHKWLKGSALPGPDWCRRIREVLGNTTAGSTGAEPDAT